MAMKKSYYTVNGRIMAEYDGTTQTDYIHDALGSVVGTVNSAGVVVDTYTYKPYGEQLAKTGVGADPKFGWVGSLGYRKTSRRFSEQYVRARHYGTLQGQWTTVDPLFAERFPSQRVYSDSNPITYFDLCGTQCPGGKSAPRFRNCSADFERKICAWCKRLGDRELMRKNKPKIYNCIRNTAAKIGLICDNLSDERLACLARWCNQDGILTCHQSIPGHGRASGYTPGCSRDNSPDPWDEIDQVPSDPGSTFYVRFDHSVRVFLHELAHACGVMHGYTAGTGEDAHLNAQCNDIWACCLLDVLGAKGDGSYCWKKMEEWRRSRGLDACSSEGGAPA